MKRLPVFILFLLTLTSCLGKMKDAESFIDEVHLEMIAKNWDHVYNNLIDEELKEQVSRADFDRVALIVDEAKVSSIEKTIGFNANTTNGVTEVKLNYKWIGQNYNVRETIVVTDKTGAFKVIGLNEKEINK